MRNLLAILGAAIVTFLVVGYYLDWYKIQSTPGSDGHRQVNIDVNAPKITQDIKQGEEKAKHLLDKNGTVTAQTPGPNTGPIPSSPNAVVVRPNGTPDITPNGDVFRLPPAGQSFSSRE